MTRCIKNLLRGVKAISILITQRQQKFGKRVTPISLFISCLTCHGLEIAARTDLYKQHTLKRRFLASQQCKNCV